MHPKKKEALLRELSNLDIWPVIKEELLTLNELEIPKIDHTWSSDRISALMAEHKGVTETVAYIIRLIEEQV